MLMIKQVPYPELQFEELENFLTQRKSKIIFNNTQYLEADYYYDPGE